MPKAGVQWPLTSSPNWAAELEKLSYEYAKHLGWRVRPCVSRYQEWGDERVASNQAFHTIFFLDSKNVLRVCDGGHTMPDLLS